MSITCLFSSDSGGENNAQPGRGVGVSNATEKGGHWEAKTEGCPGALAGAVQPYLLTCQCRESKCREMTAQVPRDTVAWLRKFYLTESVYEVILKTLIPTQIRQLILYHYE